MDQKIPVCDLGDLLPLTEIGSTGYRGRHWGTVNTATPQKKNNDHRITAKKVDETPTPQFNFCPTI